MQKYPPSRRPAKPGKGLPPTPGKKPLQERSRRLLGQASIHLWPVMAGWLGKKADSMVNPAPLFILRSVVNPPDTGQGDRSRAHGARLQSHVKITADQSLTSQARGSFANGKQLSVGGGVFQLNGPVPRLGQYNALFIHNHCADGHFATRSRSRSLRQGDNHRVSFPGVRHLCIRFHKRTLPFPFASRQVPDFSGP